MKNESLSILNHWFSWPFFNSQNWNSSSILSVVKGDVDGPESSLGLIQPTSGQSVMSGKNSSGILAPRVPSNKNKSRSKTG